MCTSITSDAIGNAQYAVTSIRSYEFHFMQIFLGFMISLHERKSLTQSDSKSFWRLHRRSSLGNIGLPPRVHFNNKWCNQQCSIRRDIYPVVWNSFHADISRVYDHPAWKEKFDESDSKSLWRLAHQSHICLWRKGDYFGKYTHIIELGIFLIRNNDLELVSDSICNRWRILLQK